MSESQLTEDDRGEQEKTITTPAELEALDDDATLRVEIERYDCNHQRTITFGLQADQSIDSRWPHRDITIPIPEGDFRFAVYPDGRVRAVVPISDDRCQHDCWVVDSTDQPAQGGPHVAGDVQVTAV